MSAGLPTSLPAPGERTSQGLERDDVIALRRQWWVGFLVAPLWLCAAAFAMRFVARWKVENHAAIRRRYRELVAEGTPLVVCANHLTLVDSFVIAWALGSPFWYSWNYHAVPWNLPERKNFSTTRLNRILIYLMKCLPIARGGDPAETGRILSRIHWVAEQGDPVLIFPEGGRSRTGRVNVDARTWGVGRIVKRIPKTRVLCLYVRGRSQDSWSPLPRRGETFRVSMEIIRPSTSRGGLRGTIETTHQILERLETMERRLIGDPPPTDDEGVPAEPAEPAASA